LKTLFTELILHRLRDTKALSEHLFRIHRTKLELRRQVDEYVAEFPHQYTYQTVPLPLDGS
jgi:hypothetical protein